MFVILRLLVRPPCRRSSGRGPQVSLGGQHVRRVSRRQWGCVCRGRVGQQTVTTRVLQESEPQPRQARHGACRGLRRRRIQQQHGRAGGIQSQTKHCRVGSRQQLGVTEHAEHSTGRSWQRHQS